MSKLLEFQKRVGAIKKDSVNPFYKSKYADINSLLDVVKPLLNELGLLCVQPLITIEGKNALRTIVFDDDKIVLESAIILPDNLDPQKIGSAITYYRRYSLQSLFLLEAEDDDAESTKPKVGSKSYTEMLVTMDKIKSAKSEKELKEIYASLSSDQQPLYIKALGEKKESLKG